MRINYLYILTIALLLISCRNRSIKDVDRTVSAPQKTESLSSKIEAFVDWSKTHKSSEIKLDTISYKTSQFLTFKSSKINCLSSEKPSGGGYLLYSFSITQLAIASAIMSIGAVKGIEIGDGFEVVTKRGSENNDAFYVEEGNVVKGTNHSGGILGGISDGETITLRAAFKPTPSIFQKQHTIDKNLNETEIEIKGRHDPIIAPRAVVVVESMVAMTILDLMMDNTCSTLDKLMKTYGVNESSYDLIDIHERIIKDLT